jgi:hypothetical protein
MPSSWPEKAHIEFAWSRTAVGLGFGPPVTSPAIAEVAIATALKAVTDSSILFIACSFGPPEKPGK